MNPILSDSDSPSTVQEHSVNVKRLFFDWSSVVAIALCAMTWATLSNVVTNHEREIERLRAANELRSQADIRIAESMATKADVQRVSDQLQSLATELRNARNAK